MRNDVPSLTRELAAETTALRMLHLPDMRTPAQKRRVMEARAGAADAAASERITMREQARAAAVAAGGQEAATPAPANASYTGSTTTDPASAMTSVGSVSGARQGLTVDVTDSSRAAGGGGAEEGPGSLSPRYATGALIFAAPPVPMPPSARRV